MKIKRAIDEPINQSQYTHRVDKLFYYKIPIELIVQSKHRKEKSRYNEFWKVKFHQSIKAEKNRVIIDNHEYMINPQEGFLAEINKEMI